MKRINILSIAISVLVACIPKITPNSIEAQKHELVKFETTKFMSYTPEGTKIVGEWFLKIPTKITSAEQLTDIQINQMKRKAAKNGGQIVIAYLNRKAQDNNLYYYWVKKIKINK